MTTRTLVARCPNWSLVAAGLVQVPSAVLVGNRVVSCSPSARAEGVHPSQRRREAEACCYDLVLVPDDPVRDVRAFEPVVAAIAEFTPRVEVTRPGVCSLPVRGPARYFGGEEALAVGIAAEVDRLLAARRAPACRVGIADSPFAARRAAQAPQTAQASQAVRPAPVIVPPGQAATWLADLPVSALGSPELAVLLVRLGIRRIGEFAALDEGVVGARFGAEGASAHRLARGLDDQVLVLSDAPPDLTVERQLDDPVDQVETVAFIAAGLAEELTSRLAPHGLACTRLLVEASTEHAEELSRWWRADRPFTARAMVDRARWQLEGWLGTPAGTPATATQVRPTAGITLVRLTAAEVVHDNGRQVGLFGGPPEASLRVERGIARIQGLLGHEAIGTAVLTGGRGPLEQAMFVPCGEPREEAASSRHPWPGRVPSPAPALVHAPPTPVEVLGSTGEPVGVNGQGLCTAVPSRIVFQDEPGQQHRSLPRLGGQRAQVVGWAGPWPVDERWWDPEGHRRRARLQVALSDGSAYLLVLEGGRWAIEGSYD